MATVYDEAPFAHPPYYPIHSGEPIAWKVASRTYANADRVRIIKVEKDVKITGCRVTNSELDSNGTPTATITVRLWNGTTGQNICVVPAATVGVDDGSTPINVDDALGFVVQDHGFWIEALMGTFATTKAGIFSVSVGLSAVNWGSESPIAPAG